MARKLHKLNPKQVEAIIKEGRQGRFGDGGGLRLQVKGGSAVWVWRGTVRGAEVELGVGPARTVTLKQARDRAHDMRKTAQAGGDPRDAKSERKALTLAEAAKLVHASRAEGLSEGKHTTQWLTRLEQHVLPKIGKLLVREIEPADITAALRPIWTSKSETANRVVMALKEIFDWAAVEGHRPDNIANPVQPIRRSLPKQTDTVEHHPAVPWQHVPGFLDKVRACPSYDSSRWGLEFMLLTAARTKEVRLATKAEIDFEARRWNRPAEHMKGRKGKRRPHSVPLSDQALDLLRKAFARWPDAKLIFPGRDHNSHLSIMAFEMLMRRLADVPSDTPGREATPHGCRSSFRTWAQDTCPCHGRKHDECPNQAHAHWNHDTVEAALAHGEKDSTVASYKRGDLYNARVPLMQAWANYVTATKKSDAPKRPLYRMRRRGPADAPKLAA